MKKEVFYTILRYRHGLLLGESLNAGILFYDASNNQFAFEVGDLSRIKTVYPGLNTSFLKRFITTLNQNIKRINQPNLIQGYRESLDEIIRKEILYSDAAGLSFDPIEKITLSGESTYTQTLNYLLQLFLVGIGDDIKTKTKKNEEYILAQVYNILDRRKPNTVKRIEKNKIIETPLVQFTFDFLWKSAFSHLGKALAFDLENRSLIQNKALQIYGTLEQLKPTISHELGKFELDFLVSKPTNIELFDEFDKALKIVESAKVRSRILFEDEWAGYAHGIIEEAVDLVV
jgi:hypothetical protein